MKTVVLADDDEQVCRLIRHTLPAGDYELLVAHDGELAWSLILEHRPDIALLEVLIPTINGYDLTYAIKRHPALTGTRVILLTGLTRDEHMAAAALAGADDIVAKPFSPAALRSALERRVQPD